MLIGILAPSLCLLRSSIFNCQRHMILILASYIGFCVGYNTFGQRCKHRDSLQLFPTQKHRVTDPNFSLRFYHTPNFLNLSYSTRHEARSFLCRDIKPFGLRLSRTTEWSSCRPESLRTCWQRQRQQPGFSLWDLENFEGFL